MNKAILPLIFLGTFASAASAQINVSMYGLVDGAIQRLHNAAGTNWGVDAGLKNASRIGFKGSDDLGDGWSAIFTLENGFNIDTGTIGQGGRLFGRQAWVGLNSKSLGTVKFGRQYTPMFIAMSIIDPFIVTGAGNMTGSAVLFGSTVFTGTSGQLFNSYGLAAGDPRTENTVDYTTPNFAGLTAEMAYSFGEQPGNFTAGRQTGINVNYTRGGLTALLAYHNAKPVVAGSVTESQGWLMGGVYNFGFAKLHAAFQDDRAENAAGVETGRAQNMLLAASAPILGGQIRLSWVRHDSRLASNADIDQLAFSYIYFLSKRTDLYSQVAGVKPRGTPLPGFTSSRNTVNVGIQHRF